MSTVSTSHETAKAKNVSFKSLYPNTWKFVKDNIVPARLDNNETVINIFVGDLLEAIKKKDDYLNLDDLIHHISSYPAYVDSGASSIMNFASSTIEEYNLGEKLMDALVADGIKCSIPLEHGF